MSKKPLMTLEYLVSSTIDQLCGKWTFPGSNRKYSKENILESLQAFNCIVFSGGTGEEINLFYLRFKLESRKIQERSYSKLDGGLASDMREAILERRRCLDVKVANREIEFVDNPKSPKKLFALVEKNPNKIYLVNDEGSRFDKRARPGYYFIDVDACLT